MVEPPDVITAADLEAAGLWDSATEPAERLALLRFLVDLGASIDELIEWRDELPVLASILPLRLGSERLTLSELAKRSGVPAAAVARFWRATGLPEPDPESRVFSEVEVELMAALQVAEILMGEAVILQLTRVIGSAMAQVADAMVSAFIVNLVGPSVETDASDLARARANADGVALIPEAARFLDVLLRRHIEAAHRPLVLGQPEGYETQRLAVGFADLVSSTALAERLSMAELGAAISDFEAMASDAVTRRGGRLVKLIGDEAMFVVAGAPNACDIGLVLADLVDSHPVLPALRVGVAIGDVLSRAGDYYGPVVNTAARAAKVGEPGHVVVSTELRVAVQGASPGAYQFDSLGRQCLSGFETPVELHSVKRIVSP